MDDTFYVAFFALAQFSSLLPSGETSGSKVSGGRRVHVAFLSMHIGTMPTRVMIMRDEKYYE